MQRKLSIKTRVFFGIAACAVILVAWQALAPKPPHPTATESTDALAALAPPDDEAPPDHPIAQQAPEPTPDAQQPQQWVQFGGYEFPRQYVLMAISLLVQLLVAAVVVTIIVLRRRTIRCPACHQRFPRSAPICPNCSTDPTRG